MHAILAAGAGPKIFHRSHSWREILNNKYPANNECAAGCSCLEGIISNFLPMFHMPTPACRHGPSLHPNAGSYHFYLHFKSIYKSKPRQTRSNELQSAGQMHNVNYVPGEEIRVWAVWSVLCARWKSTKRRIIESNLNITQCSFQQQWKSMSEGRSFHVSFDLSSLWPFYASFCSYFKNLNMNQDADMHGNESVS